MQKPLKSLDLWKHRLWVRVAESGAIYVLNAVSTVGSGLAASAELPKKAHKMLVPDQTKDIKSEDVHDANLCWFCTPESEDCDCEE
jgi:hypothetical protein